MTPSDKCSMCKNSTDNIYLLGEKITFEDVTAHHFCLLLSAELAQNGLNDLKNPKGIHGFMPKDIENEILRAQKLKCTYCHQNGANISCCHKKCKKAFHLPCAIENNCRFEFVDPYKSFCSTHRYDKKPKNVYAPNDLCTICYDEMGEYNPIRSLPLPCCDKKAWCHLLCLQKYAHTSGYFLKCPLCKDSHKFRRWISKHGVFIPNSDAKWEETGQDAFYDFQTQQNTRPRECTAEICRMPQGRRNIDENDDNLLISCEMCGSKGIHKCCLETEVFLCDDCDLEPPSKKRKRTIDADEIVISTRTKSNHIPVYTKSNDCRKHIRQSSVKKELKTRRFNIVLQHLTEEQIVILKLNHEQLKN